MKRKHRTQRKRYAFQQQFRITGIVALAVLSCVLLWLGLNLPDQAVSQFRPASAVQERPNTTGVPGHTPTLDPVVQVSLQSPSPQEVSVSSAAELPVQMPVLLDTAQDLAGAAEIPGSAHGTIECMDDSAFDARTAELMQAVGLTRHLDELTWREQLPDRLTQALVPASYYGFSVREALCLELDAWGDNMPLASVFYEVTQVTSPEGQVLSGLFGPREPMVGQRIRVPVQRDTEVDEAMIRFEVRVPGDLEAIVLDVSSGQEVRSDMRTGTVALAKISDQAVRLTYREMSVPTVYAFDRMGNVLRRERISREQDGVHMTFGGYVETCLLVGVKHMIDHAFMARVPLSPGQAAALSYRPEVPKYTRFDPMPLVNYTSVSSLDVNDLAVHWRQEKQQRRFRQILSVELPENVAVKPSWEVYAHQRDEKVRLNGSSMVDSQRAAYRYNGSKQVDQMSGSVWLNVCGKIERITLSPGDLEDMCCVALPRGKYLDVHLDKNKLSYMVLGGDVIQVAAFDSQGRRLRQDPAWRIEQGMKSTFFWGIPVKVVMDVSTQTKVARLDFSMTESLGVSRPLYTTSVRVPTLLISK